MSGVDQWRASQEEATAIACELLRCAATEIISVRLNDDGALIVLYSGGKKQTFLPLAVREVRERLIEEAGKDAPEQVQRAHMVILEPGVVLEEVTAELMAKLTAPRGMNAEQFQEWGKQSGASEAKRKKRGGRNTGNETV